MMSGTQSEIEKAGKDMLLKIGEDMTGSLTGNYFSIAGHGFEVNDLVQLDETEGSLVTTRFYFVSEGTYASLDATIFGLSDTPSGTLLSPDATDATLTLTGYKTIGGLRSKSFSFSADDIDISNHGTNQWKKIKSGAGMRSVAISGSGVYTNASNYRTLEADALANNLVSLAFMDIDAGRIYSSLFKVNSLEASGEYDGEASFSISANSSGTVSIAQLGT